MKIIAKLLSVCLSVCFLIVFSISNTSAAIVNTYYENFNEYMKEKLAEEYYPDDNIDESFYNIDLLTIHSNSDGFMDIDSINNETSINADYVLAFCTNRVVSDSIESDIFGDYYIINGMIGIPYVLSYHILTPADGKVYTIREAFDSNINGIDKLFSEHIDIFAKHSIHAGIVGDTNFDSKINVKDATEIQKCVAKLNKLTLEDELGIITISDFNRDGKRDIRDATAIQKYIVGLEF